MFLPIITFAKVALAMPRPFLKSKSNPFEAYKDKKPPFVDIKRSFSEAAIKFFSFNLFIYCINLKKKR